MEARGAEALVATREGLAMVHGMSMAEGAVRYPHSCGESPENGRFLRLVRGESRQAEIEVLSSGVRPLECGPAQVQGRAPAMNPTIPSAPIEAPVDDRSGRPDDAPFQASGDANRREIVGDLYLRYRHRVEAFSRRLVGPGEAEELVHETFVRLLRVRNLERMTIGVAYLLRIAQNLARRKYERAERYRTVLERSGRNRPDAFEIQTGRADGWTDGEACSGAHGVAIDAERLESVLRLLTREEQAAIRLIVCEGLEYQAAANSLGVNVSTVNNWKHRGLTKLKLLVGNEPLAASRRGRAAAQ